MGLFDSYHPKHKYEVVSKEMLDFNKENISKVVLETKGKYCKYSPMLFISLINGDHLRIPIDGSIDNRKHGDSIKESDIFIITLLQYESFNNGAYYKPTVPETKFVRATLK